MHLPQEVGSGFNNKCFGTAAFQRCTAYGEASQNRFGKPFFHLLQNLNYLTEFVCSIRKENTAEGVYKDHLTFPARNEDARGLRSGDSCSKVSSVLQAIRNAVEQEVPESPPRELCILTTLARSDPPVLEEALHRIKLIRGMELSGSSDPRKASLPSADEALKHPLWLSDSEAVFESALGFYDLNFAAMVALNFQKDPKEFLPFLRELQRMPTLRMLYNIDIKLHYENALKHIASAGDAHYVDFETL